MPAISNVVVQAVGQRLSIELPRPLAAAWPERTELSILAYGPEAATFVRGPLPKGQLAGTLSTYSLAELFDHIISAVMSGMLVVTGESIRRTLMIRDGQIIFASSTAKHERLGASLVRTGVITQEALTTALEGVGPGARLGQVLTQKGMLSPSRLYAGMVQLVREIVLDLFTVTQGEFLFLEGVAGEESVKLQERTRDLVLEGMRRGEEIRALRRALPPELTVTRIERETATAPWLERASSVVTLGELWADYEGSEYTFLLDIKAALTDGTLAVGAREEVTGKRAALSEPSGLDESRTELELYAELVRIICHALSRTGQTLEGLRGFLEEPLPSLARAFEGVTLSDEGALDFARIQENLAGEGESPALIRAHTYEAIDAFISYALFSAKNVLKPELAAQLNREFEFLKKEHA